MGAELPETLTESGFSKFSGPLDPCVSHSLKWGHSLLGLSY